MTGVFDDPGKQSSERLLVSEACRKTNSHNPAGAACRGQVPTPIRQEYPLRATERWFIVPMRTGAQIYLSRKFEF
jgi:hypothetical protein